MFNIPITAKYYLRYDPCVSTGRWSSKIIIIKSRAKYVFGPYKYDKFLF